MKFAPGGNPAAEDSGLSKLQIQPPEHFDQSTENPIRAIRIDK
jgi:hypothetical protein